MTSNALPIPESPRMTQRQGDRLGFYLGLTGSRPITLSLESSLAARRKAGLPLRMAEVVAPWRHRIAALTISSICRRDDSFLRAFILTGLPSLERVGYGEGAGSEVRPLLGIWGSLFPQLRSLRHSFG